MDAEQRRDNVHYAATMSLLPKLHSESWLSSMDSPRGHKGLFEWSPRQSSRDPVLFLCVCKSWN